MKCLIMSIKTGAAKSADSCERMQPLQERPGRTATRQWTKRQVAWSVRRPERGARIDANLPLAARGPAEFVNPELALHSCLAPSLLESDRSSR
jgi:hypothetical protein